MVEGYKEAEEEAPAEQPMEEAPKAETPEPQAVLPGGTGQVMKIHIGEGKDINLEIVF